MFKKAMLLLLLSTVMMTSTACVIGIKEKRESLFVSPVPIPEAAKGAVMIATNEKIPLAIVNREGFKFEQKVTGYVIVDPWFYDLLIDSYKKSRKKKP